jgi:hypothetical protein
LPSGGKVVLMGFGFEAVNRPSAKPTYLNRMQLMSLILTWFGTPSGLAESRPLTANSSQLPATIVRGRLILQSAMCNLQSEFVLLDASGRRVLRLRPGANDLGRLPAGVYFVRTDGTNAADRSYRLLLVR